LLGAMILMFPRFSGPIDPQDEGMLLVYPQLMLHGSVANRDFFNGYPPGDFWILSGAYRLFSLDVGTERMVGAVYRLMIIGAIYGLASGRGPGVAGLCAAVSAAFVLCTHVAATPWQGALALTLWSVFLLSRAAAGRDGVGRTCLCLAAGLLAGLTICVRIDTPAAMVVGTSAILLIGLPARLRWCFVAAASLGLLPLLVHLFVAGFSAVVQNCIVDCIFLSRASRKLPIPPTDPDVRLMFYIVIIAEFMLAAEAVTLMLHRRVRSERFVPQATAVLALLCFPQALQRLDAIHLTYVACVAVALLPAALDSILRQLVPLIGKVLHGSVLTVAGIATVGMVSNVRDELWWRATRISEGVQPYEFPVTRGGRTVPEHNAGYALALRAACADVDRVSSRGDRLFVGPLDLRGTSIGDTFIYFLFPDRTPATYYLEMEPGVSNRPDSSLGNDIASAKVLILSESLKVSGAGSVGGEAPIAVVQTRFRLFSRHDPYLVYVCSRAD